MSLAGGRVAAGALSWAWLAVAARGLPLGQFGDLALLLALGSISAVLADLGLPLVLMKAAAEQPSVAFSALNLTIRRRAPAALVGAAAAVLTFAFASGERSLLVPAVFGLSILATTVYTSVNAAFRSLHTTRVEAANEIASRLFVLVVGGFWLARGGGLLAAVVTYAAADVASALVLYRVAARRLPRAGTATAADFTLRGAAPLALGGILGTVHYRVDVLLLAAMTGPGVVAVYAAASRVLDGLLLPAGALSAVMVPLTASLEVVERGRLARRLARAAVPVVGLGSLAGALLASPVLSATFGGDYARGAGALRILLLGLAPAVAVLVMAPVAALADRAGFARVVAGGLAVNVGANLALIPALGAAGAACATLVSQVALALALRRVLARGPGEEAGRA